MTDALTGIYNRFGQAYYEEKFQERSKKRQESMAFLFLDLNKLKYINDNFGHEGGDAAIQTVADTMKKLVTPTLKAFRYGGDEFLMIAVGMEEPQIVELMEKLTKEIVENGLAQKLEFSVSASIGYSIRKWDEDKTIEDTIKEADEMMYRKKRAGM